jgi:glycosyltransferase involved in cell wall biosynthesis
MIHIFTPSWADESNTNAQNLTVKEIVSRLDPEKFHVTMFYIKGIDPRFKHRPNMTFIRWRKHGNTLHVLIHLLFNKYDIFFYPRYTVIEKGFFYIKKYLFRRDLKLVTHIVHTISPAIFQNNMFSVRICRDLILQSDAVFGNSHYVTETVKNNFGIEAQTIHNGVDRRFFYPEVVVDNPVSQPISVLYVGSFQARKRPDVFVKLAQEFSHVEFKLAGQGPELEACKCLVESLTLKNVKFLGHMKPEMLGEEMRKSDIFLFPSIHEGHPQVLGQAAACRLPCIAMACYRPDYIVHGKTGFLVEKDDDLITYLNLLIEDSALRQRMGNAAEIHMKSFDWDVATQAWSDVFDGVLDSRG